MNDNRPAFETVVRDAGQRALGVHRLVFNEEHGCEVGDYGEVTIEITNPETGQPIGLTIVAERQTSPRIARMLGTLGAELYALRRAGKHLEADAWKRRSVFDAVVATVLSWTWAPGVTFEGEVLECTPENVRRVFGAARFIARQVDSATDC